MLKEEKMCFAAWNWKFG